MIIIGLTGGIACGKSTCSKIFKQFGCAHFDADAIVHDLMKTEPRIVFDMQRFFPHVIEENIERKYRNGGVDEIKTEIINRSKLAEEINKHPVSLDVVVDIMRPFIKERRDEFLRYHRCRGTKMVLLDVPLLFESGWDKDCDYVINVSVPINVQKRRIMSRPDMTEAKMKFFLDRQLTTVERDRRSDFIIRNGLNKYYTRNQISKILRKIS